jgi:hypothetical protein
MDYQDLIERPLAVVENVLDVLGGAREEAGRILETVTNIKPPSEGHKDPNTLYFVNHVTAPQ